MSDDAGRSSPTRYANTSSATTSRTRRSSPTPSSTRCSTSWSRSRSAIPELRTPDSPTPARRRRRFRHRVRRGRAPGADAQPRQRVQRRRARGLGRSAWRTRSAPDPQYLCELKIDGVALALVYRDGRLDGPPPAATAASARTSRSTRAPSTMCPKALSGSAEYPIPPVLEVRGEVFFLVADFETLNASLVEDGQGAVRQSAQQRGGFAAAEEPARSPRGAPLRMICHGVGATPRASARPPCTRPTPRCAPGACRSPTTPRGWPDLAAVRERIAYWGEHRHDLEHEIDGVVVKVDDFALQRPPRVPPRGRRAGRSPTSTRPRRRRPSCSTSRSTSGAPAGSPRSR